MPMHRLAIVLVLAAVTGCERPPTTTDVKKTGEADAAARWGEVVELAAPLVPAAPAGALADVSRLRGGGKGDVRAALIAWAEAKGGLPAVDMQRPKNTWWLDELGELGVEVLKADPGDPRTRAAVAYLGHRLRAEGPSLDAVADGFEILKQIRWALEDGPPPPEVVVYTPTEAEIRRGIAAEAVVVVTYADGGFMSEATRAARRASYARLVLDAPPGRAEHLAHVEALTWKRGFDDRVELDDPAMIGVVTVMYDYLDAHRKWTGK